MDKELAVIETKEIQVPAIAEAVDQYNMMVQYVNMVMKKGIDYGEIPGTDKPTLLKPGAEKLQRLFKLRSTFETVDIKEDWDKPFFYYRYKCQVWSGDQVIAECEGSTNSYEKKYRYRNVYENKATAEEKETGLRMEKTSKKGSAYIVYRVENKEPFDIVNTFQKMAQKRAYVGAILLAANASEFFTQDMEDLSIIDAEFTEQPTKATKTAKVEDSKQRKWTSEQIAMLAELYPDKHTKNIVSTMNLSQKLTKETSLKDLQRWFEVYAQERKENEPLTSALTADNKLFG